MFTILTAWLLADFLSGIGHWYEDKVLNKPNLYKFLDDIQRDNEIHHDVPSAMTRYTFWQTINTTALITVPITILLFLLDAPTILTLAAFFATFANQVHKYSHMPKGKRPKWVLLLQGTGLFITFEQHQSHHFDENGLVKKQNAKIAYCPMTSWLNPVLDKINFWTHLERFFGKN
jgi:hypothetical protein